MLNAHSCIAVPHEMKYFGESISHPLLERWRDPGLERAEFEYKIDKWLRSRKHIFEEVDFEAIRRAALDTGQDFRAPFRAVMEAMARHRGKRRWGENTPGNLFYADIIADMFPEAQFIYLVRDPRAVVCSMNAVEFFTDDTVINAYNWREAVTRGGDCLREHTSSKQQLTVHYEQLIRYPEATLRRIGAFLGEAFEPGMLAFHAHRGSERPSSGRTPSTGSSIEEAQVETWKHTLSAEEIALVETVCRAPMERLGYESVSDHLGMEARVMLALKSCYWMWKRHRSKGKRNFAMKYAPFARFRSQ